MGASDPAVLTVRAVVPALDEHRRIAGVVERLCGIGVDRVVVVDGGSRDGTADRARQAGADVRTSRPGRALQMNVGALGATEDVLWFVHADARPPAGARRAMDDCLSDPSVVAGAFTTRTVCDVGRSRLEPVLPLADVRSHYTRLPYGDQALFVRRVAFERVGGFPLQPLLEDVELARRLWGIGRVVRRPERVEVSARRFLARPAYYSAVMNLYPVLYGVGVSADRLARWYGNVR